MTFFLKLVFVSVLVTVNAEIPQWERQALVDFYYAAGGPKWLHAKHWLKGDACSWYGVTCDPTNRTVIRFFPNHRKDLNLLKGYIPESISNLTNLEELYLSNDVSYLLGSGLSGPIPTSITTMKHLRCFYVSHNHLNGTIPEDIGNLPLQVFLARKNKLTGGFPPSFAKLVQLDRVWVDGNRMSGTLDTLKDLPVLRKLHAEGNSFSGRIPASLCALGKDCHAQHNSGLTCPANTTKCCQAKCSSTSSVNVVPLIRRNRGNDKSPCWRSE